MVKEEEVQNGILELLQLVASHDEEEQENSEFPARITTACSYDDVMMLTYNKGIVLEFDDGSEFQITIVRSKRGKEEEYTE